MVQKGFRLAGLCIGVAAMLLLSAVANAQVILRLGNITDPKHSETKAQEYFADLVNKKTDGAVQVKVFSSSQLGDAVSQLESIRLGAQDMYGGGTGNFGKYVKDWNITSVGFVFRDTDHFLKVLDSDAYKAMENALLAKTGMRFVLRNGARPGKPIISTKPIFRPDDFKGMKVRVPPWEGFVKTFETMGARTVSIPWGETYLAMRQGMAEATSATVSGFYGIALHEVAPYLTLIDFFNDAFTIVISDRKFKQLKPEHQKALLDAGEEAGRYYTKIAIKDQEHVIAEMIKKGAFVIRTSSEPFVKKMEPIIPELEKNGLWTTKGLFQTIQSVR